jgi:hypothetical protein
MLGRNIAWSILALGVASAMWACSSDGDDSTPAGGAGGASAGAGGHAAGAGGHTAGGGGTTAQGGTAGKGGTGAGGGSAGKGGTSAGGNAAAGTGDALGGEGGVAGGSIGLGGAGGEVAQGGEGGASAPTLADNCATACGDQTALSCSFGSACVAGCIGNGGPPDGTPFPEEYAAMMACQAKQLTAAQYYCSTPSMGGPAQPAPAAGTACETLICKWTCDDANLVDENVYARCGC